MNQRLRFLPPGAAPLVLLLLGGCGDAPPAAWSGYAEGDYVYIASPIGGRLDLLAVQAGQQVTRGAALFTLDAEAERAARDEAAARLDASRAQAADAGKGRRSDEIAVTAAQLAQARAQAELARSDLARQQQLVEQGFISKARLDDARTAVAQSQARLAELEASLRVARLPARQDALDAAQAQAAAASQALRQSDWRTQQKQQTAPADARVAEVFFRQGELVAAGQPVLSLLPPMNLKARFFVPEAELGGIATGQRVTLQCDGCGAPIEARISRIATQPEYTPPVIYANAQRARLVFLVEARPEPKDAVRLHPGQPLDVRRVAGGP
jgi:HlyD family secretion protein